METASPPKASETQPVKQMPFIRASRIHSHARLWMGIALIASDAISLFLAGLAGVGLRYLLGAPVGPMEPLLDPPMYLTLLPLLAGMLAVYALRGLYPAVGISPVEELRRLTTSTSLVILLMTGVTFWLRNAERYSRLVFAFSWAFALLFVPVGRWITRYIAVKLRLWGEPVLIFGDGPQSRQVYAFLASHPEYGFRPVAFINGIEETPVEQEGLPVLADLQTAILHPALQAVNTVILLPGEMPANLRTSLLGSASPHFRRLILISDLSWIGSLGVTPYDMQGMVGLEIHQNLLSPWQQGLKLTLDLALSLAVSLILFPLILLIALWVKLDSPGNVFYRQRRIGRGGQQIEIIKFRTMYVDSDAILAQYITEHPEQKSAWDDTHKLVDDPRITRLGRLLRRASLDELPQLWNVLKGEMSLVGPRPFLPAEIGFYQKNLTIFQRVRPGMTGLWQVHGRASLSFDERVRYDEYYVRNWSVWLDLYILLRTAWVVLRGEGAY